MSREDRILRLRAWASRGVFKLYYHGGGYVESEDVLALLAENEHLRADALLAGSELDWLIGYLSETDAHAADHARRGRAALGQPPPMPAEPIR